MLPNIAIISREKFLSLGNFPWDSIFQKPSRVSFFFFNRKKGMKFRLQGIEIIKSCVKFHINFGNHLLEFCKINKKFYFPSILSMVENASYHFLQGIFRWIHFLRNPSMWPTWWDIFCSLPCSLKFRTFKWDVRSARKAKERKSPMSYSSFWNSYPQILSFKKQKNFFS